MHRNIEYRNQYWNIEVHLVTLLTFISKKINVISQGIEIFIDI